MCARYSAGPPEMEPTQGCHPHYSAGRADTDTNPRHRHRYQRQRLLCRNAFALSHRSWFGRGAVAWDGKGYDTCLGSHQRSESWHGNRICRSENQRSATGSGVSPGDISLQLFNRAPKPKSAQLERDSLCCLTHLLDEQIANRPCKTHSFTVLPPRPPRHRLRTNPPIASAPAGCSSAHPNVPRRRTCR